MKLTTEDDFQHVIDANPEDWPTRQVFADWLDDRADPRAAGYRAIAVRQRRPLQGHNKDREAWWWCCPSTGNAVDNFHNIIPPDWFALLAPDVGNRMFWPVFTATGGIMTRRECEDALARAFSRLPAERQAELLTPPKPNTPRNKSTTKKATKHKKPTSKKPASKKPTKRKKK
jgi:uncharacterized protein (TIGR02996 family)